VNSEPVLQQPPSRRHTVDEIRHLGAELGSNQPASD
jgi:hypothetical protein